MADLTRKIASFLMGDILGRGLAFITSVYLARTLGAEGFGLITIALSFLGYVAFFGDFGLHHIGIRETAKLKEKQDFNTTEIFIARIILGFLAFGIGFMIIPFLKFSDVQVQLIKGFIYALGAYAFLLEWYFYGRQKYFSNSLALTFRSSLYLILVILFVRSFNDILYVPYIFTTSISAAVILLFIIALKENALSEPFRGFSKLIKLFKSSAKIGSGLFFTNIIQLLPPLAIGYFLTAEDAGLYSAAFKMIIIVMMVDRLLVNLLIPNLSHQWNNDKAGAIDNLKKANKLMLVSGAILALGLAMGAPDFAVWIFGEEYVDSIPILIILCGMVFLTFQNSIFSYGLMAIGEDKAFLKSTALSGTISLVLIICASKFTDLKGVAYAVVISELLITLISYLWFSRFVKLGTVFNSITTILVSMLIFWLSFSLPLASWLESLLLSALLFIILYLVRVIRNEEILWLRNKFTA